MVKLHSFVNLGHPVLMGENDIKKHEEEEIIQDKDVIEKEMRQEKRDKINEEHSSLIQTNDGSKTGLNAEGMDQYVE